MRKLSSLKNIINYQNFSIVAYIITLFYFIYLGIFGKVDVFINLDNFGCKDYFISSDDYDLKTSALYSERIELKEGFNEILLRVPLRSKAISLYGCESGEILLKDVSIRSLGKTHSLTSGDTSAFRCAYCDIGKTDDGLLLTISSPKSVFLIVDHVWEYPLPILITFIFVRYFIYFLFMIFMLLAIHPLLGMILKDKITLILLFFMGSFFYFFENLRSRMPPALIKGGSKAISASHYSGLSIVADYIFVLVILLLPIIYILSKKTGRKR